MRPILSETQSNSRSLVATMKENHYEDRSIHNFLKTLSIYQIDNDLGYTLAYNMLKNLSSGHITVRSVTDDH